MDEEKLVKKLESLKCPDPESQLRRQRLKLVLVNARRSSWIGLACIAFPSFFILGVLLKYGFHLNLPLFTGLEEKMVEMDRSALHFLSPVVMAGAPLAALVLNLVAITHFHFDKPRTELQVSVKLRIVNLLIIAMCLLILAMLFVHAVAESGHPQ
jgi:hypothetical protein